MARPRKNNADYFSHDNNMRKDTKIDSVRVKFGNEGYAIWCMLLEVLTEKDSFRLRLSTAVDWELLAGDFRVDCAKLKTIIDYLSKLELIEWDGECIFCKNLDNRLAPLIEKREAFRAKYSVSDAETPVSDAEMPQSKVNKSKVNISKDIAVSSKTAPLDELKEQIPLSAIGSLNRLDVEKKSPRAFANARRAALGKPPIVQKLTKKQIDFFQRSKLIDVFKQAVNREYGTSYFIRPDDIADIKKENSKISKQIKDFFIRCDGDLEKAGQVIRWYASGEYDFAATCNFKPGVCFRKETVQEYENKNIKSKKDDIKFGPRWA